MRNVLSATHLLPALLFGVTACASPVSPGPDAQGGDPRPVACTDPRPQMCTMEYDPVCARLGEGDDAPSQSFANGCSACGDPRVTAYIPGGECR